MTHDTNIPQGYKATALGIIPQEWEIFDFDEIVEKSKERYIPNPDTHLYCIELEHLSQGEGTLIGYTDSAEQKSTKNRFQNGDVLFGKLRPYLQKYWLATFDGVCSTEIWVFHAKPNICLKEYLLRIISSYNFIQKANVSSGSKMPRAEWDYVSKIPVLVPPLAEQRKIADVLGVWDEAIEKQARLIEKLALRKRALMQRLLSAKLRLPGFSEPWQKVKLGDIASIKTGNKNNEDKISNGQYPFFVRSSTVERINSYSYDGEAILIPGEGKIGEIIHYINGKFDYHQRVYKISDFSNCSGLFLYYYLMYFFGKQAINNSVKACVDSLRLSTFTNMTIMYPPISEQNSITEILTAADREIELAKEKLERLRRQKRGLMQQLLTGKKRVI